MKIKETFGDFIVVAKEENEKSSGFIVSEEKDFSLGTAISGELHGSRIIYVSSGKKLGFEFPINYEVITKDDVVLILED